MPKHILIVDDDAEVRTVLGNMLEDAGYQVSLVRDGAEMRVFLERDKTVDAIVLDSVLPGEKSAKLALHAKSLGLLARLEKAVLQQAPRDNRVLGVHPHAISIDRHPEDAMWPDELVGMPP